MKLQDFIITELESILQAWENFARDVETTLPIMDSKDLRNHSEYILKAVAADMRTAQNEQEQIDKAHGHGPQIEDNTPAQTHAMKRIMDGFSMDQMVSEYRALRSSVLRLWLARESSDKDLDVQQIIRFNEAIDQALVESIATFGHAVETTRKTVLGVLGHDLRAPLGAITMASGLLQEVDYLHDRENRLSKQIYSSVSRANTLVSDLLDMARCNLGTGIPACLEDIILNEICYSTVEELRTAFPDANIIYKDEKNIAGHFDPVRIAQVFSNIIGNAICHGSRNQPIHVTLIFENDQALFSVQNQGEVIPTDVIPHLFNLGGRHSSFADKEKGPSSGLGLGLFIASQIVAGHDGKIEVKSTAEHGTIFRISLPLR